MIFAFGLFALAACAKVEEPVGQDPATQIEPAPETHSVQVFIDKADDTKTSVVEGQDGATYIWTEGDEQYLHVYENGVEGQITGIQFSPDYTSAALTVTFSGTPAAPYTYTAKYAKTIGEGGNPVIRADQKPTSSSFDPAADVMISRADADVTGLSSRAIEVSFTMGRVVSVNRMMLTGLVAGEKVSKVEFTLGKNFVGSLYEGNQTYTGGSGKLTATYDTPLEVNALGQFPVYFTCAPVADAAITSVVVTTDQNVYTKSGSAFSGKSISFAVGTMKRFNMSMKDCGTPVVYPIIYKEVTSASQIVDGGVYLVSSTKNDNSVVAMSSYATGSNKYYTAVDVTVTNDQTLGKYIELTTEQVVTVTLESAGSSQFYIKDSDGQYLNYSGSSNNVSRGSKSNTDLDPYKWTVAADKIESVKVSGRKLQYNASSPRFACYSSSQRSIALYKQGYGTPIFPLETPGNLVATSDGNGNVHVEWDAVSGAASYTVTCTGQTAKTGVTTTSTDFTGLSAGSYTITVKAISADQSVNLDSEAASTEVTVTVTSPKGSEENPYTASEAIEEASKLSSTDYPDNQVYVTGIISNVASYSSTYSSISYYISDDGTTANQFYIYSGKGLNGANFSSKNDLAVGWKVVLKGKLRNYQGNTPELYYDNVIISLLKPATATVTTGSATSIGSTQVTLNGSYAGASGQISETGFYYGTSQNGLTESVTTDGSNAASGSFSCPVTGLAEGSTYYYKAYVLELNAITGQYEERLGSSVGSFTTTSASANVAPGYLGCYEVPSIPTLSGTGTNGWLNDRGDKWFRYNTSSTKQKVITHTFVGSKQVRNYTVMFDGDKHAPLWAAFPMHKNVYNGSTERSNAWTYDPALPSSSYSNWQQTGLDNAQTVGYSRGHLVASMYRKYSDYSNLQTFYYTNQAPQWQNGFNSGVWSTMEERLVTISPTSQNDTIYVVTGVLYEGTISSLPSGSISVPIPSHFYTCAMKCTFNSTGTITAAQGIAFVFTNESHTGENYYSSSFVTSIDAIETRTGFEFFPNVPAGLQNAAEANTNHTWFTGQSSNNINDVTDDNWGTL